MALNESTLNVLKLLAEADTKAFHEGSPEDARLGIDLFMAQNAKGPNVRSVTDHTLAETGVTLRLITPKINPTSIIIYYHGGGWLCGSIDAYESVACELAVSASALVFLVDYRLAPEHPFPTGVNDCWDALLWVDDNRPEFCAEGLEIILAGDSAGGNLAAVVAQRASNNGPDIAMQVLIYPATDTDLDTPSSLHDGNQLLLTRQDMVWFWNHYVGPDADRSHPEMAPARSRKLAQLPPSLIITAQHDVLNDDGKRYVEKLKKAGVDVQHIDALGETHGFMCLYGILPSCQWAIDSIASFIDEQRQKNSIQLQQRTSKPDVLIIQS